MSYENIISDLLFTITVQTYFQRKAKNDKYRIDDFCTCRF